MNRQIRNLRDSFVYAFRGLFYCLRGERNMRIHLTAGAFVLWLSGYYQLSSTEIILLLLSVGTVISTEMINTAVEVLVNLETTTYHPLARIAKDVAAGAVLVCALFSVGVGLLVFWDIPTFKAIWQDLLARPLKAVELGLLVATGLVFIFAGPAKIAAVLQAGRESGRK